LLALYRERMGDWGDSTALLVGAFDVDEAVALAQQYLGTLPADRRSESWSDRMPPLPGEPIAEALYKGIDPRSYVFVDWTTPFSPTLEGRVAARALENVVDILVREQLREEMGGIYGAGVSTFVEAIPNGELTVRIQFTAEPGRVVELVDALEQIVAQVVTEGPDAEVVERARQQLLSNHEENLQVNDAWLTWLDRYVVEGEGPATDVLLLDEAIEAVTAADLQALARQAFAEDAEIRLELFPAENAP
jgi:zinc protease